MSIGGHGTWGERESPARWVMDQDDAATAAKRQQVSPRPSGEVVPLQLPPPEAPARDIQIELQRGATMIKIGWRPKMSE